MIAAIFILLMAVATVEGEQVNRAGQAPIIQECLLDAPYSSYGRYNPSGQLYNYYGRYRNRGNNYDPRNQDPIYPYQEPRYRYQDARYPYQDPRYPYQEPRYPYQDPRYPGPTYQDPRYPGQTYQDPRYPGPTYQDPRYQGPTYQDPRYQDPIYQDSRLIDPTPQNPGSGSVAQPIRKQCCCNWNHYNKVCGNDGQYYVNKCALDCYAAPRFNNPGLIPCTENWCFLRCGGITPLEEQQIRK